MPKNLEDNFYRFNPEETNPSGREIFCYEVFSDNISGKDNPKEFYNNIKYTLGRVIGDYKKRDISKDFKIIVTGEYSNIFIETAKTIPRQIKIELDNEDLKIKKGEGDLIKDINYRLLRSLIYFGAGSYASSRFSNDYFSIYFGGLVCALFGNLLYEGFETISEHPYFKVRKLSKELKEYEGIINRIERG